MGLSGMGFGASQALEDIVAQRIERQKLEAAIAEQMQRDELARASLEQRRIEEQHRVTERQRDDDRLDADRRQRTNAQGVRRMLGEAITQGTGEMNDQDRRGLAALQVEAGDEPSMLPQPKKPIQYTYTDPKTGGKSIRFANPDQIPATGLDLGNEPPSGSEKGPFVVNGRLVSGSGKVLFDGTSGQAGPSPYAQERNARTSAAVDDIIGNVSGWTAGYGGLLANLPQSAARELRGKLNTLKANIAFNELAAMREASKTGGALGSVAVRELELLENSLGNLDQLQEPQSLISELTKIKDSAERWRQASGGSAQAASMRPATSHAPTGVTPAPTGKRFTITKVGG